MIKSPLLLGLLVCLGCSSSSVSGDGCSTSSDNTILFDPPISEVGEYVVSVDIGGETGDCRFTISAQGVVDQTCTVVGWAVLAKEGGTDNGGTIGSTGAKEAIGLLVGTGAATSASVVVKVDGAEVKTQSATLKSESVPDDACITVDRLSGTVDMP